MKKIKDRIFRISYRKDKFIFFYFLPNIKLFSYYDYEGIKPGRKFNLEIAWLVFEWDFWFTTGE